MLILSDVLSLPLLVYLIGRSEQSVWMRRLAVALFIYLCMASYPEIRGMFIDAYDNARSILKIIQR